MKVCGGCKLKKAHSEFYKLNERLQYLCKPCFNAATLARGKKNRVEAVNALGGKCMVCGFGEQYALEFHHLDPSTKDPRFGNMRYWSSGRTARELKGCV